MVSSEEESTKREELTISALITIKKKKSCRLVGIEKRAGAKICAHTCIGVLGGYQEVAPAVGDRKGVGGPAGAAGRIPHVCIFFWFWNLEC